MSIKEWAKREIKIACKREKENTKDEEWNYGVACYESAYRAFECLLKDNHSGFSIGITKSILNRLIDGKPLTPITEEDEWQYIHNDKNGNKVYQCMRMSSLFKHVHEDGTTTYNDINRLICVNVENGATYHANYINRIMNGIVKPINLPYMPSTNPYYVYCEECLYDTKNGDFDSVKICYYIDQEGRRHDIDICLKADGNEPFRRCTAEEYELRRKIHNARVRQNS